MVNRKIANLPNGPDNKSSMELHSRFATREWYIINDKNNGQYGEGNENDSTIKLETKVIKPFLYDYFDPYILMTGDIKLQALLQVLILHLKTVLHISDVQRK